jgi:hypothetical protein
MKKFLPLFLLVVFSFLSSCSGDDANKSTLKATIDEIPYVFNTFSIEKENYGDYTDVIITASIDRRPDKVISLIITESQVGANASHYFTYFLNQTAFEKTATFITNVTQSSSNRVQGTFSGEVLADDGSGDHVEISNGSFDVYH